MAADATSIEALALAEAETVQETIGLDPLLSGAALATETPEASATEPVDEEATPEGEPEATQQPTEATPDEPDDQDILAYMKETHTGLDYGKYQTDEAFLKGAAEAMRLAGRREEDAQLGKQVRGALGDQPDQLEALLKGQLPAAADTGEDPDNAKSANGRPEWDPTWITQSEDGKLVPAMGAPKDVEQKYQAYSTWMQRQMHAMVTDPNKFFGEAMSKQVEAMEEKSRAAAQAEVTQHQQDLDIQSLAEKHRNLLHVDGDPEKGVSAEGKRVGELFAKWKKKIPDDLDRLDFAIREVQRDQPKPPPRRPRGKAIRQPGVASVEPEQKTVIELINENVGLAEAMERGVP